MDQGSWSDISGGEKKLEYTDLLLFKSGFQFSRISCVFLYSGAVLVPLIVRIEFITFLKRKNTWLRKEIVDENPSCY